MQVRDIENYEVMSFAHELALNVYRATDGFLVRSNSVSLPSFGGQPPQSPSISPREQDGVRTGTSLGSFG